MWVASDLILTFPLTGRNFSGRNELVTEIGLKLLEKAHFVPQNLQFRLCHPKLDVRGPGPCAPFGSYQTIETSVPI